MTFDWLTEPLPANYFHTEPAPIFDAVRADEGPATTVLRVVEVAA